MKKHWDILFLTFLFLSGCGQKDLPEAVPIAFKAHFKLGTEVNVYSKAPVTNLTDMGTIYICRSDGSIADFSSLSQPSFTGTVQSNGTVTPSALQYYQSDGTAVHFRSFRPQAWSMEDGVVNFRITGQEDIMAGICNYAGYAQNPVTVTFGFSHLLSQLDYEIVAESQAAADAWGTLTYIKVTTPTSLDLDLNSNILTTNTDPVEQDLLSSLGNNAAVPITTTYSSAGNVMIPSHNAQLILKIKTSTSEELTIPTNLWYLAPGNIHKITLTFRGIATDIPITATLSGWPE
jgi:hypothetical protein